MDKLQKVLAGESESHVAPFLWVRGEDEHAYRAEIQAIYDSGIRELCIEARPHPDFNGPGWWHDLGFIMDECKARGMRVWLLDDSHFPTGYANGEVKAHHPELRKRFLRLQTFDVMGPCEGAQLNLKYALMDREATVLAVLAQRRTEDDAPDVRETIDLTPTLHQRDDYMTGRPMTDPIGNPIGDAKEGPATVVDLELPEGPWYVQVLTVSYNGGEKETEGYLNPIDAKATQVLLDTVYQPVYEHFASEFGKTFQGFFSDEPRFGNIHGAENASIGRNPEMVLPWSGEVPGLLAAKLAGVEGVPDDLDSEGLTRYLPLLFVGAEDDRLAHAIRYEYMDLVSGLYSQNFDGVIADWCHAHGVRHIGHTIEDDNAIARLGYGPGHFFRALAHADMAGIDVVMEQLMPGYDRGLFRAFHRPGWDMEFFTYVLGKIGGSLAHLDARKHGLCMAEVFGAYGWGEGNRLEKWILDYMLVRGVNVFVPHAFSPKAFPDGDCPPHLFAQGHNPQYPEFAQLMAYAQRLGTLLSGGRYNAPVALYFNAEGEWSGDWQLVQKPAAVLARSQVEYDIVSADWLLGATVVNGAGGRRIQVGEECFRALVLPWSEALPAAVVAKVAELSHEVPVLFVGGLPRRTSEGADVAGVGEARVCGLDGLVDELRALGVGGLVASEEEPWLRTYHYEQPDYDVYLLVNEHPSRRVTCRLTGAVNGHTYIYDAFGNTLVEDADAFSLDLAPYGSRVVIVSGEPLAGALPARAAFIDGEELGLGSCTLSTASFEDRCSTWSAPETLEVPCHVTALPGRESFCGRARYAFELELTAEQAARAHAAGAELRLTGVSEAATVRVNGTDCGTRLVPDYAFDVAEALREGENEVVVEVNGTLARAMDDFIGQYLPLEPLGLTGATLVLGR